MAKDEMMNVMGWLDWILYDENGNIKEQGSDHNQIQNQLKRDMAARLLKGGSSTASYFTHMKLTTAAIGAIPVTATSFTWIAGPATVITTDGTASQYVATYLATVPAGRDTGAIASAGFLSTPTASGLRCAATCVCTKDAGDSLALTWTLTFA